MVTALFGFPDGTLVKESPYQRRGHRGSRFSPWVWKIPWRRESKATHSSILAWRIPWTGEPGGLQPTGSQSGTRLSDFPFSVCVFVCVRVWVASTDFWCLPPAPAHDVSSCCTIRHGHPSSVKLPKPGVYPHVSGPACCLPLQARPHGGRSGF